MGRQWLRLERLDPPDVATAEVGSLRTGGSSGEND